MTAIIAKLSTNGYASKGKVVIEGISRGALVAGLVAASDKLIAGIVLISGVSGKAQQEDRDPRFAVLDAQIADERDRAVRATGKKTQKRKPGTMRLRGPAKTLFDDAVKAARELKRKHRACYESDPKALGQSRLLSSITAATIDPANQVHDRGQRVENNRNEKVEQPPSNCFPAPKRGDEHQAAREHCGAARSLACDDVAGTVGGGRGIRTLGWGLESASYRFLVARSAILAIAAVAHRPELPKNLGRPDRWIDKRASPSRPGSNRGLRPPIAVSGSSRRRGAGLCYIRGVRESAFRGVAIEAVWRMRCRASNTRRCGGNVLWSG